MKRFVFILAAILSAACSPQLVTLQVEMRYPSRSGLDLSGKTIAVVCMDAADTVVNTALSNGLARSLEETYFESEEVIPIFRIPADSVSLEKMHSLVMDTGMDVVFLFDKPELGDTLLREVPMSLQMYVYDSMEKADSLHRFTGNAILERDFATNAETMGRQISRRFKPMWKPEAYSLYYYEWGKDWSDALDYAYKHKWAEAIELWMKRLDERNPMYSACASYNIAVGYYMTGHPSLALKWLDQSEKLNPEKTYPTLRKRIQERL